MKTKNDKGRNQVVRSMFGSIYRETGGRRERGYLAAVALIALLGTTGAASADEAVPPFADAGERILNQGAAALRRMTLELERTPDWGARGATELASVLERETVSRNRFAGNDAAECGNCHEI